ncbi:MAG: hypothetical protein IJB42_01750 [Oscillospiraceae bacterium]|nr:hypothetical protein [Oscillospiraceae bacterium]
MSFSLREYAQSQKRKEAEQEASKNRKFSLREYAEAKKSSFDGALDGVVLRALHE